MKQKPAKLTLGQQIDRMRGLDVKIDAREAALKKLKQKRAKMESKLLRAFKKQDIDGTKGKIGVARIRTATFWSIKDRRKFDKYVLKHKALDLFQNRPSAAAIKARHDEGETVPGLSSFERIGITITKRGAK